MSLPTTRLIEAARARGLTDSKPILLTTDGGVALERINIIVSKTEPVAVKAPLDLIWIDPSTGVPLRRVSRASSNTFAHTWTAATEENFWQPQIWDEPKPDDQPYLELNRNVGNAHLLTAEDIQAISVVGGTMTGPLNIRQDVDIDAYSGQEALPKTLVKKLTDAAQGVAASVYQQMASVRSQLTALRGRVTVTEMAIEELEKNPGSGGGIPQSTHKQEDAQLEWIMEHNLNTVNIVACVVLPDGQVVIPDKMEPVNANTYRVTFAEARAGTAMLIGVRA